MSKTLANSLALLNQIKTQFESKETGNKEIKPTQNTKSYGSIKRSYVGSSAGQVSPYLQGGVGRSNRQLQECELRQRFEMDFQSLQMQVEDIFQNAKAIIQAAL